MQIDVACERWRGTRGSSLSSAGIGLRELVVDPVLRAAGDVDRLYLALDDALHLVALDALPLEGGEGEHN